MKYLFHVHMTRAMLSFMTYLIAGFEGSSLITGVGGVALPRAEGLLLIQARAEKAGKDSNGTIIPDSAWDDFSVSPAEDRLAEELGPGEDDQQQAEQQFQQKQQQPEFAQSEAEQQQQQQQQQQQSEDPPQDQSAEHDQEPSEDEEADEPEEQPGESPSEQLARYRSKEAPEFEAPLSHPTHEELRRQPHLILILADDLSWSGVGYNNDKVKTPFIDEMANQGIILEDFYTAALCGPSRYSLLTGRAAWRSEGFGSNNLDASIPIGTSLEYTMLPAVLKTAGYVTHAVGKWHQGFHQPEYLPQNRGFDTFYGILSGFTSHFTQETYHGCDGHPIVDLYDNNDNITGEDFKETKRYGDERFRERAVDIIGKHDPKVPLFLYFSSQMPHAPYQVPKRYKQKYFLSADENVYYGMMSHLDETASKIAEALNDNNMYTDSLILFMSDNGAADDTGFLTNYPLSGHKGQVLQGGTHVPAFLAGGFLPSRNAGKKLKGLVHISDWYATLAYLAGGDDTIDVTNPAPMDSHNHWGWIAGDEDASRRNHVMQLHPAAGWLMGGGSQDCMSNGGSFSFIEGNWKLLMLHGTEESLMRLRIRPGQCVGKPCLFDIGNDPYEEQDLSNVNPDVVDSMKEKVDKHMAEAVASPWFGRIWAATSQEEQCWHYPQVGNYKFLLPWAENSIVSQYMESSSVCQIHLPGLVAVNDAEAMLDGSLDFQSQ